MCGICGIVHWNGTGQRAETIGRDLGVSVMLEKLRHRGPQGPGLGSSGLATFGTQRLAIRSLDDGDQPILDRDSGVIAVCNGEIDNHRQLRKWLGRRGRVASSGSDVAILPQLYLELGPEFVERLEGVFSIALFDPRSRSLVLARDRAGERSLYFVREATGVRFATEIAALAAATEIPLEPDTLAIADYLRFGCFVAPSSPYREIRKVRPGEIVILTESGEQVRRRYWRWPILDSPKRAASTAEFDQIFRGAVQRQSDANVDYGLFLSGGLDSSLVAAAALSVRPECRPIAYTVRFAESSYDEGASAKRAAAVLDLELVSVQVQAEDLPRELAHLVRLTGEPLADPAWIPTALLARRAAADVRFVLSGEGADELFGGYPTYLGAVWAQRYHRLPRLLRAWLRTGIEAFPPSENKVPLSYLLKRFVEGEGIDGFDRHLLWTSAVAPAVRAELGVAPPAAVGASAAGALLDRVQMHDVETTLAEGLLTKADRGGMSSAVEIRAPFLDRSVMEFAATLRASDRVHGFSTKHFLKRYARRYLPWDIVHRRKRGLSVPLATWLRGPLREWADAQLRSGRLDAIGLRSDVAVRLLARHASGGADFARALWTFLVLDAWLALSPKTEA